MVEVHTNLVHEHRMRVAFSLTYDDLDGNFRPTGSASFCRCHAWRHALLCVAAARG